MLRGPAMICSLGYNPLPTSSSLLSLSLSPFPSLLLTGEKKKTKVIDNNLDPEWNEVGSGSLLLLFSQVCSTYLLSLSSFVLP